jgi:hypothetical protein
LILSSVTFGSLSLLKEKLEYTQTLLAENTAMLDKNPSLDVNPFLNQNGELERLEESLEQERIENARLKLVMFN